MEYQKPRAMKVEDLYTKVQLELHRRTGGHALRSLPELSLEIEILIGILAKYLPEMSEEDKVSET